MCKYNCQFAEKKDLSLYGAQKILHKQQLLNGSSMVALNQLVTYRGTSDTIQRLSPLRESVAGGKLKKQVNIKDNQNNIYSFLPP